MEFTTWRDKLAGGKPILGDLRFVIAVFAVAVGAYMFYGVMNSIVPAPIYDIYFGRASKAYWKTLLLLVPFLILFALAMLPLGFAVVDK